MAKKTFPMMGLLLMIDTYQARRVVEFAMSHAFVLERDAVLLCKCFPLAA